jgi:hypothetical protein
MLISGFTFTTKEGKTLRYTGKKKVRLHQHIGIFETETGDLIEIRLSSVASALDTLLFGTPLWD